MELKFIHSKVPSSGEVKVVLVDIKGVLVNDTGVLVDDILVEFWVIVVYKIGSGKSFLINWK